MMSIDQIAKTGFVVLLLSMLAVPAWAGTSGDYTITITTPQAGSGPYIVASSVSVAGTTSWQNMWPQEYIPNVFIQILDCNGNIANTYFVVATVGWWSGYFSQQCTLSSIPGRCTIMAYAYSGAMPMGAVDAVGVMMTPMPPPPPPIP